MPALAKHIAMPPPIVPPPITAACAIGRGRVPSGMPGTLAASRSAKKTWRCAFDWSPATSLRKSSLSRRRPSSNGSVKALRTASTQAAGASRPRSLRVNAAAAASNAPGSARAGASLSSRSRTRRNGRFSARTRRAKTIASVVRSPSAIASRTPSASASAAGIGSPVTIILSAFSGPTSRGRRCVPPAPGRRPSLTSGRPTRAVGAATRKWQASANSNPPPSAAPWIAATTGFGIASIAAMTSPSPGACGGLPNSVMSAPAKKVRPAQAMTTASTDASSRARANAAASPARTSCFSALTGGLSTVTTAISPSRRKSTLGLMLPIAASRPVRGQRLLSKSAAATGKRRAKARLT